MFELYLYRAGTGCLAFCDIRWLSAAGLGVLVLGVVLMLVFCKCPHCGAHMRLRERKTGYCPECGKKLDD